MRRIYFTGMTSRTACQTALRFSAPVALLFAASCIFESESTGEFLEIALAAGQSDSLTIVPRIVCAFSEPVADSAVAFKFSPAFVDLYPLLNASRDTVTLVTTRPLSGSTRYVISAERAITAVSGLKLYPAGDSVVIFTLPSEQEPNGTRETADLFQGRMCGICETASDTDTYVIGPAAFARVSIVSEQVQATFFIEDSTGARVYAENTDLFSDTVTVPETFIAPVSVTVFPSRQVGGFGYYVLGLIAAE